MPTNAQKPGIPIDIPGFGQLHIKTICSDFTGTLSWKGKLIGGVKKRLRELSRDVDIHVVTSDTRKAAAPELKALTKKGRVTLVDSITDKDHAAYKEKYMRALGLELREIAVFGNGRNDANWLKAVKDAGGLAVAVDIGEGCATEALTIATVFVSGITNALDLLLDTKRVIGTLRTEGD
jgi:soluble P-type ATPase